MSTKGLPVVAWHVCWEGGCGWTQYHDACDPLPAEWDDPPDTITPLTDHAVAETRIKELEAKLGTAIDRMDRARSILTDGKPTPRCNWGLLDTSDLGPTESLAGLDAGAKDKADAERLYFVMQWIDGYVGVDKDWHEYACDAMEAAGATEMTREFEVAGIRALLDTAMKKEHP